MVNGATPWKNNCLFPQFSRPEFALMAGEAPVTLYLPGSIVVTAGLDWVGLKGGERPAEQYPSLIKL